MPYPVTPAVPSGELASSLSTLPTYTYHISATATYATPTDWVVIRGSATKTIKIVHVEISGAATAASAGKTFYLKKHTVANTSGTSTNPTPIKHDSNDASASATVLLYTVAPTIDATAATLKTVRLSLPIVAQATNAGVSPSDRYVWDIASEPYAPIVLRGVAQEFAVNLNSAAVLSGEVLDLGITWVEV